VSFPHLFANDFWLLSSAEESLSPSTGIGEQSMGK
jgi:hypothetical protein